MRQAKPEDYPYNHFIKNEIDPEKNPLFKTDWLNDEERQTASDLFIEYQKQVTDMDKFLQVEYAALQNRVNKCLLNRCYLDIFKERPEVRECVKLCVSGISQADTFVKDQFEEMKTQFGACLEKAHKDKFIIQSVFRCYDNLNNAFPQIKLNVREEFNYYQ